jgi:uncharacterized protein YceK
MKKLLLLFALVFTTSGCTVSITLTDTHGYANDVVDETSKADADIDADLSKF